VNNSQIEIILNIIQLSIPALAAIFTGIATAWAQRRAMEDEHKRESVRLEKERLWRIEDHKLERVAQNDNIQSQREKEKYEFISSLYTPRIEQVRAFIKDSAALSSNVMQAILQYEAQSQMRELQREDSPDNADGEDVEKKANDLSFIWTLKSSLLQFKSHAPEIYMLVRTFQSDEVVNEFKEMLHIAENDVILPFETLDSTTFTEDVKDKLNKASFYIAEKSSNILNYLDTWQINIQSQNSLSMLSKKDK
jgi:hypothetical protein